MRTSRLVRHAYDRFFGYDVFISYSRKYSTNYAISLQRQLQALGLTCFLDQRDIYAGAPLDSLILAAIERSSAVVPVITRGTEVSAYVPVEIAHALKLGKHIVPISIADEVRVESWSSIQRFRWIDESASAACGGVPSDGIVNQIKQSFTVLRRAQFRRIVLGAVGLTLSAVALLAFAGYREARIQQSFGLYTRGLEVAATKDKHAAKLYFAAALERNDSPEVRLAMTSVLAGPRWRWDFQIPPDNDANAVKPESDAVPKVAFSHGPGVTLFVIRGRRLLALEASSGSPKRILNFSSVLTAIAVDGNTGSIAIGDAVGRIFIFRDNNLSDPRSLFVDGPIAALKFNSDGSLLGVGVGGGGLRVLDPTSGEPWYRSPSGQHEQTVDAIAFAARSSRMIWSMGRWLYASEPMGNYIHLIGPQNDDIAAVAWDSNNDVIAAAGTDGPIQLVNLHEKTTGPKEILSTRRRDRPDLQELAGHTDGVTALQLLSVDDVLASTGYDGRLKLWDTHHNDLVFSVNTYDTAIADLAVSDDAALIATVSRDARVRVWDAGTDFGATVWTIRQLRNNASFAAQSGGNSIDALVDAGSSTLVVGHASGSVTAVEKGDAHWLVELQQVRPRHDFLRMAPDGRGVLSVSPVISSASLPGLDNTGLTLLRRTGGLWATSAIKTDVSVIDAAWTDRPGTIAILAADKRLVLGTLREEVFSETWSKSIGGASEPARIATAARADVTAVAFRDGSVVTFDHGARGEFKARTPLRDIVLSGDGRYLAIISSGPQARTIVRDVARGETLIEIQDWISDAAFDPMSTTLLFGSDPRGELILYDLRRMREQSRWLAHSGGVRVVTFSSDGKLLYSGGNDGYVRSWPIKALEEIRDAPASTIREHAEQATGLALATDGIVRIRPGSLPTIEHIAQYTVPSDNPDDIKTERAVFAVEGDDKEQLDAACRKLGEPDHAKLGQTDLGFLAAAAICADVAGRTEDARARYRSFYEAAVAQGDSPGGLLVSPGLARGAGANLTWSIETRDDADLSTALRLINLVYQSSWRPGSLVRLPPAELVGDYIRALESITEQPSLHVIDQRANEFIDGLGPDWLKRATSPGEAEVIPRLLFNVGVAHLSHDDALGAYGFILRAADLAAAVVGDLVMSGDPSETEARQFWTQVLAGSAALGCHVAAQAGDEKKDAISGHSVSDLLKQARESAVQASEQWRILGENSAQDEDTKRSMSTLRDTLAWCATLLNQ